MNAIPEPLVMVSFSWSNGISTFGDYLMQSHPCRRIGLMSRVFANGPEDWGSIPGRVIPKTQKMVFDASLLNIQHYKVRFKGKAGQSWKRS